MTVKAKYFRRELVEGSANISLESRASERG